VKDYFVRAQMECPYVNLMWSSPSTT